MTDGTSPATPSPEPGPAGPAAPDGLVRAPSVELPRGGGAIRGIGEKFSVETVTGTASLAVPVETSPGRSGFGPRLLLAYDSGSGNGPFGFGWSLRLPAITRKTDKGLPTYDDADESDVFVLSGTDDLVPLLDPVTGTYADDWSRPGYVVRRYRPRIEGLFARVERWTHAGTGDVHWRSTSRDDVTTLYGATPDSRVADPDDPSRVFSWLICESHDDVGNAAAYAYVAEDAHAVDTTSSSERTRSRGAQRYPRTIRYGNVSPLDRTSAVTASSLPAEAWHFEVLLEYDEGLVVDVPPQDPDHPDDELPRVDVHPAEDPPRWAARPDPFSSYRAGFETRTHRRCTRALMYHRFPELGDEPYLVASTDFGYADFACDDDAVADAGAIVEAELAHQGSTGFASFLRTVTRSGYVRDPAQNRAGPAQRGTRARIPPLELEYTRPVLDHTVHEVDRDSARNTPAGVDGDRHQWVDLDGEGVPGVLVDQAGTWFYQSNDGDGRLAAPRVLPAQPSLRPGRASRPQVMDLAGDGALDLVFRDDRVAGFYERGDPDPGPAADGGTDPGWRPFVPLELVPTRSWADPDLRFVDLTGDGLADILVTEDEVFTWHRSLGERGFDGPRRVRQSWSDGGDPRLVFADGTGSLHLADMTGDGLVDLVRVRNGEVAYWPSLGYGRFGAKVTMADPPWFEDPSRFDQARLRLADVDGTGVTDIVYLATDAARLYLNRSGNGWSGPVEVAGLPADQAPALVVLDLLGTGTACLVWSSPLPGDSGRPLRYVDLLGSRKPHLLSRMVNNLGAVTEIAYSSSTSYSLRDRARGRPWSTRLPFPVQVVSRVEVQDRISGGRSVERYAYHDGHFDGVEREFHGFGMVERWDADDVGVSDVPPSLTRRWFHTGRARAARCRLHDDPFGCPLEDDSLPEGLSADEDREARRALKGLLLREEVYGRDGGPVEDLPYTVEDRAYAVRLLQHRPECGPTRHAVFLSHPRESVSRHHERVVSDPRVRHALTLEVDDYGNVLTQVAAAYGRCTADPRLDPVDQATQARDLVTCTHNEVTNAVDDGDAYRTPVVARSATRELTGVPREDGRLLTVGRLRQVVAAAEPLGYHEPPVEGRLQARLVEEMRTLYRRDDLTGPLPLGRLQALALPFETYRLSLTRELVDAVFGSRVDDEMLRTVGGYADLDGDGRWWLPSGRVFYSPGTDDPPETERAHAEAHFFLTHRVRTPFHTEAESTETTVSYDHDLLVRETTDPLGNRVTAGERDEDPSRPLVRSGQDYRVLRATLVMDPNRNRSAAAVDALGLVAATATLGAPEDDPAPGDRLDPDLRADLTRAEVAAFAADPRGPAAHVLLGEATTRLVYDLEAFVRDPRRAAPVFAASIGRETHVSELPQGATTRLQVSFAYSDGYAREVQKKGQAEPGEDDPQVPRWLGTGWTVYNAKNKPVRRFEPFFSATHEFERDVRIGISALLCYDPLDRVVATVHPNHTFEKVVLGAWSQQRWDTNDTVLVDDPTRDPDVGRYLCRLDLRDYRPSWYAERAEGRLGEQEAIAAARSREHAGTPSVAHTDPLGRAFLTVGHNRLDGRVEAHLLRVGLDVEGNQREVWDATGRLVSRFAHDLAGRRLLESSMDGGERRSLGDVAGSPVFSWDARGLRVRTDLDPLRRPRGVHLQRVDGSEILVVRTTYGESRRRPERHNLRGKVVRTDDQSGTTTTTRYDFKGNLLRSVRRLARDYRHDLDWSGHVPRHPERYVGRSAFDALNRPVRMVEPDGTVLSSTYNEAGLLTGVRALLRGADEVTTFVSHIAYNAKGQRTRLDLGNGAVTHYRHDPLTFRLTALVTERPGAPAVQDLHYTYDPAGNVTHVEDGSQQPVFHANQRVDASTDYVYDALYRLLSATGRERLGRSSGAPTPYGPHGVGQAVHPEDGAALGRYREHYTYDRAGNLTRLAHRGTQPDNAGWTRTYSYDEPSRLEPGRRGNRLTASTVGGRREVFSRDGDGYDAAGAMLSMPHLPELAWDHHGRLRMTRQQHVGRPDDGAEQAGERTWYVYDAGGARVRKVTERADRLLHERVYLGAFEVYREHTGAEPLVRETLGVLDDNRRVALVETRTEGRDRAPARLIRYQLADVLGSVAVELDERGRVVSFESYSPYGSTTYEAVRRRRETPKRYRFTGKERDEETGLSYHGARYYAPWLCRWTTGDPGGLVDGPNTYTYVSGRPTALTDPAGGQGTDAQGIMAGMMWDEMGREMSGMIEGIFGGSAYVNPRANVVEYSGPQNGVGGVVGGVVRAVTVRLVPIEDHPSIFSLMGMEAGAGVVPLFDPAERLVAGTTVTGQDTSRGWAAVELAMDVVPFLLEARAARMAPKIASSEARMMSMEARMLTEEADLAAHIGAGETRVRKPTVTNPTCRGDLCVADVGAHEANLRNPGLERPLTNTDLVAASGRDVSRIESPITQPGEAASFLDSAFEGLRSRIAGPIKARIEPGAVRPGNYLAVVDGPQGGHALHATVTEERIGTSYRVQKTGQFVNAEEAADLGADGVKVIERPVYRTEYYDPQNEICVQPQSEPRAFIRLE